MNVPSGQTGQGLSEAGALEERTSERQTERERVVRSVMGSCSSSQQGTPYRHGGLLEAFVGREERSITQAGYGPPDTLAYDVWNGNMYR